MVHISLRAEEIFHIGDFSVTNALLMSVLALLLLGGGALLFRRKIALIPGKMQGIFELVLEAILDLMDSVLGDRRKSERYLPIVATIFLFVMISNWLGLLPGVGSIFIDTVHDGHTVHTPLFRSAAADLNFTLALGVLAVISINILGILAIGIRKHVGKFFDFSNPINFFVGILELISEFAKIISFSFRLFGNVFAGEVLLTIVAFLVPYVVPLPFLFLETFVGFIQAFVFAMLALVFIAIATVEHGAEEHH